VRRFASLWRTVRLKKISFTLLGRRELVKISQTLPDSLISAAETLTIRAQRLLRKMAFP
jgi:hypothetical protein